MERLEAVYIQSTRVVKVRRLGLMSYAYAEGEWLGS